MNPEEQTRRLAAFPTTNPNPVLEFAADGSMTYCNQAGRDLAASLGAESPASLVPADTKAIILECLATGEGSLNLQTTTHGRTVSWSFIPAPGDQVVHCYENPPRQIAIAAERASQLINQLLMFSRKQVMQQRHANLNDIIQNISPMLHGLVGEHVVFEFIAAPDLPALSVDVGMMEQVLVNLVINARDAMREGGRLVLTTSQQMLEPVSSVLNPEARPGHYVCLTVADTGCGMDATTLSHMFEPFFTTKEPGKGTGLGLATVYGIVKQHQGWVVVESQLGQGTTFTLFLPSGVKPAQAVPPAQPGAPALANSAMSLGDETILVVEDEPALRELVVNVLELCGYRILQACTGVEALKVWEKHKNEIDLLLTDMVMPEGISGRQLAERLQAEDPALKVIYTSGYSPGMAGKDIALLEGFNFLAKPYPPSRLANVVRECLDGKRKG